MSQVRQLRDAFAPPLARQCALIGLGDVSTSAASTMTVDGQTVQWLRSAQRKQDPKIHGDRAMVSHAEAQSSSMASFISDTGPPGANWKPCDLVIDVNIVDEANMWIRRPQASGSQSGSNPAQPGGRGRVGGVGVPYEVR